MNIFIAGISYNLSNADLGELFEEFGEVISAKIVMDRETGRSKGGGNRGGGYGGGRDRY